MHLHILGICGTFMGGLAKIARELGHRVTGCDAQVYPPMSEQLRSLGIELHEGYDAGQLDRYPADLYVVGNAMTRGKPVVEAMLDRGLRYVSGPQWLADNVLQGKWVLAVAGTHGKSTTSAMLAWILEDAGLVPGFLVGGIPVNFGVSARASETPFFVIEADEYDTAYFDKGPKFLHYRARTAILTSIEFDHADIYRDMAHYESAYVRFAETLPADGVLAVCSAYPNAIDLARRHSKARVVTYGAGDEIDADYAAHDVSFQPEGAHFVIRGPEGSVSRFVLPMSGRHNVENAAGVYAAARALGLTPLEIAAGFASFRGVKRRQEERGEPNGILVIDDFAHHPTAVRETIHAVRLRYPQRRLWAVFEPRSNTSRRNIHQHEYEESFDGAARVSLKVPEPHDKVPMNEQLDVPAVAAALKQHGIDADYSSDVSELVTRVAAEAKGGDVILVMSNGAFGGFIPSVLGALEKR